MIKVGLLTFDNDIYYFVQWPLYILRCTPLFSTFIKFIVSFDSSFLHTFEHLLSLWSFDSPKGHFTHKQVSIPIAFNDIELVSIGTIASTTYLGSWALVASIIVIRFTFDQRSFFLEALAQIDNNTFPL